MENNNLNTNIDRVIDLKEIIDVLWNGKLIILITLFISSTIAITYSLTLANEYKSEVTLASASNSNNLSQLANQYSSVARIAGISIPSSGEVDKVAIGLKVMQSLDFFEVFIDKHDLLIPLMASKNWENNNNRLVLNKKIYDSEKKKWVSDVEFSINGKPSIQTAHRKFLENFTVSTDKQTGFVTMTMTHHSPYVAKNFLELLIDDINEIARSEEMSQAKKSIDFLEKEIQSTQLSEVRNGINDLIQKQIETIMIANATPEYLFKILSSPSAPELKFKPKRGLICIFAFLFSGFFACLYVLMRKYITNDAFVSTE